MTSTGSGMKSCSKRTKIGCSGAPLIVSTLLELALGQDRQPSTDSLADTHTQSYEQSNAKGNDSWSSVIHGGDQSGLVHGRMVRRSGRRSGWRHCRFWVIHLVMTGSLSWSVSCMRCGDPLSVNVFFLPVGITDRDFLDSWQQIDRTRLFDSSWIMSSQWLHVHGRSPPSAWGFGDVSCKSRYKFSLAFIITELFCSYIFPSTAFLHCHRLVTARQSVLQGFIRSLPLDI